MVKRHSTVQFNTVQYSDPPCVDRRMCLPSLYLTSSVLRVQAVLQLSFYTIYTLNFRDFFFECWNFFILLYIAALWPWGKPHLCRFSLSVDNRKALSRRSTLFYVLPQGIFSPCVISVLWLKQGEGLPLEPPSPSVHPGVDQKPAEQEDAIVVVV